jgi:tetratricopeptide (TPR) repeat protein
MVNIDRYDDSLVVVRELVAGSERAFGAEDPRTLDALKRESIVLRQLHRNAEALPVAQRAARIALASLGPDHPATVDSQIQVGVALFELERYDEALPILEKALEGRKRLWGKDAEITLTTSVWVARAHQRVGHLDVARRMFEHLNTTAIATMGEDNPNALPFGQTLGMFLEQTGQHADAERLRRELIERAKRLLPAGHVIIAKFAWDLGETLASTKQDTALVAFYAQWLPEWKKLFGDADDRVMDAERWLGEAQQRLADSKR